MLAASAVVAAAAAAGGLLGPASPAAAAPVDFTQFVSAQGVPTNFADPNWTTPTVYNGHSVSPGQIAIEDTNADTTMFVGPASLTLHNKVITGDIYFGSDDDYVGLAFGVNGMQGSNAMLDANADYVLLQWKGTTQSWQWNDRLLPSDGGYFPFHDSTASGSAPAGLSLSRVKGLPTADEFWQRASLTMYDPQGKRDADPTTDPILGTPETDSGGLVELGRGAVSGSSGYQAKHSFEVHYSPTNIKVFVDGQLEFDVNAPVDKLFPEGTLALYEQAQAPSGAYAFFDVRDPGDPAPAPPPSLLPTSRASVAKVSVPRANTNAGSAWAIDATTPDPGSMTVASAANIGDVDFRVSGTLTAARDGVLMATVRENGLRHNGDPNDARYGVVESPHDSGFGGTQAGIATGTFNADTEWNTNVAIAYFPYSRFRGGYYVYEGTPVAGVLKYADDLSATSPYVITGKQVPLPSIVKYGLNLDGTLPGGSQFFAGDQQVVHNLKINGVDSQMNGLLFVTGANNEGGMNHATSIPLADGSWTVAVRDSDATHYGGPDTFERDHFNFLYLEQTDIPNSVAARVTGFSPAGQPAVAQSWGDYTLTRAGRGLYQLSVTGGPTYTLELRGHHLVGDLVIRDTDADRDGIPEARSFTNTQDLVQLPFDAPFSFAFIPLDEATKADGMLLLGAHDPLTLADDTVVPLPRWLTYEEGAIVQWTGAGGAADPAWGSASNWNGAVPDGAAARAYFLGQDANAGVVNLGGDRIIGTVRLENANPYTLQGTSLQLGDASNHGTIELVEGSHAITAPVTFPGGLTINGAVGAGTLTVPSLRGSRLNLVNAKVAIAPNGTDAATSQLAAFTMTPGSRLELNDNDLTVDYGATAAFPEAALRAALRPGYNAGGWDGAQGIVSDFAHDDPKRITGLAAVPAGSVLDFAGGTTTTWSGVTVDDTSVLVTRAYYGDTDVDGAVGPDDYLRLDTSFMLRQDAATGNDLFGWLNGDVNYDGTIDAADYYLFDKAFSLQGGPLARGAAAAVPEPAACAAGLLASLGLLARRNRNHRPRRAPSARATE